jgi:Rap1a immunity proteins
MIGAAIHATQISFIDGNDLLKYCKGKAPYDAVCLGYIEATADLVELGPLPIIGWRACFPDKVSVGQLEDVVVLFLEKHPEIRHAAAGGLVGEALAKAFPCR